MTYVLNTQENRDLETILDAYYMPPVISVIETYVPINNALDYLHDIFRETQPIIEALLDQRQESGIIRDKNQARKSIIGKIFEYSITYVFYKLKQQGVIAPHIFIISKKNSNSIQNLKELMTINIGSEAQKPDADLFFYKIDTNNNISDFIIVSLKTSLRERAGQTYRWKLLMEIASCNNPIKDKYDIQYQQKIKPKVCFATVNFYDEINQPQHRGMLKFFDKVFIGKPIEDGVVCRLSQLIEFLNSNLV